MHTGFPTVTSQTQQSEATTDAKCLLGKEQTQLLF